MCGIVGYAGNRLVQNVILGGLACLEYRGYDSTGFACIDQNTQKLASVKVAGSLDLLKEAFKNNQCDGFVGMGHTRWATHGAATQDNAHPHVDCTGRFAVVHNGIIENFQELKADLIRLGHTFISDSDSEVIVHLAEEYAAQGKTPAQIIEQLTTALRGSYAFILMMQDCPDTLFVARSRAPLCLGVKYHESNVLDGIMIASDPLAFQKQIDAVAFLPDKHYAIIAAQSLLVFNAQHQQIKLAFEPAINHVSFAEKGDFEHFMLKEIYEQKQAIFRTVYSYRSGAPLHECLGISEKAVQELEHIYLVGCGTSWHAGSIGKFFLESIARVPVSVELASEFRYHTFLPRKNSICIAISQSGETADTLEAVSVFKDHGVSVVALTNVPFSSLVRESQGLLLTEAGPEIAVASTKAFSTQVATLYWMAHQIGYFKKVVTQQEVVQAERDLVVVAEALDENIELHKNTILTDINLYQAFREYIFLGRHVMYPFALEAALKLKEISYLFCHAYPAGELKHGPLALIDKTVPVVLFSHTDPVIYQKLLANAQEVKARGGYLIIFACQGQTELIELGDKVFMVPEVKPLLFPLALTGLMQYFCYALAKAQGRAIDKPRNLAKSVTVE